MCNADTSPSDSVAIRTPAKFNRLNRPAIVFLITGQSIHRLGEHNAEAALLSILNQFLDARPY